MRPSPIEPILAQCRGSASWSTDVGRPQAPGWIAGSDLRNAHDGPLNTLLTRIGERAQTTDRRTIAASFAVRYGWASAMGIAPCVLNDCVPDISLENISLKFRDSTFLERTAVHEPRGTLVEGAPGADHPQVTRVATRDLLLRELRAALVVQSSPVVDALHAWSGFSRRGTWGLLTSSWAAHVTGLFAGNDQRAVLPALRQLFAGDDLAAVMQPRLHAVTYGRVTHLYQRRASCCRWYLLPKGELCTSCPLVSHEERVVRNLAWMRTQADGAAARQGHT